MLLWDPGCAAILKTGSACRAGRESRHKRRGEIKGLPSEDLTTTVVLFSWGMCVYVCVCVRADPYCNVDSLGNKYRFVNILSNVDGNKDVEKT